MSVSIPEDGYIYAYIVNETDKNIHFDDFTFSVTGTRAIRKTDYYPFGAVAKQWNNPDQTQQEAYRHGYQGEYAEMDTTTGWNAFQLRMYDPLIGRWLQVDPYRVGYSPYIGMSNRPNSVADPDGGCPEDQPCPDGFVEGQQNSTMELSEVAVIGRDLSGGNFSDGLNFAFFGGLGSPNVSFSSGINQSVVSDYTLSVLQDIASRSGEWEMIITSTARGPQAQAQAMFDNSRRDLAEQRRTYYPPGQGVLNTYETFNAVRSIMGYSDSDIVNFMRMRVMLEGPSNVSNHAADLNVLNTVDISLKTILDHERVFHIGNSYDNVRVLYENNVLHFEVGQPGF